MAQVTWSGRALDDLRSIHERVAHDNATAAAQLILQIALSVRRLRDFPLSGRVVPEFEGIGVREIIVRRYRVAYEVRGEIVQILKIQHGARLLRRSDIRDD